MSDEVEGQEPSSDGSLARRARPAGPAAFGWRWIFPLVSLAAAIAVPFLFAAGGDAVLSSTGGIEVDDEPVDDPASPGYLAFVVSSPTSIVFDLNDDGDLVGAAFLALAGEAGGRVLVVPAELAVEPEPGVLETLSLAYDNGGVGRARAGFERLLGITVDEVIELDPARRAAQMEPSLPIDYSLVSVLVDDEGDLIYERGRIQLDQEGVVAVATVLGPEEEGFLRAERQERLWADWIEQVVPQGVAFDEVDTVADQVELIGAGPHRVDLLPVVEARIGEGKPFYLVEDDTFATDMVDEVVVFPKLFEDDRPSVQVENGTTDQSLHGVAADAVELQGGRVVVISNAVAFDRAETLIEVYSPEHTDVAEAIAAELGGVPVRQVQLEEVDVDLKVVIGSDLVGAAS